MLRTAALLLLTTTAPAFAATSTANGQLQASVVITGAVPRTPAARAAGERAFPLSANQPRVTIEHDGEQYIKLIYY